MGSLVSGFTVFFRIMLALVGTAGAAARAAGSGDSVSIAAASNLVYALDALNAAFAASRPHVQVIVATGASGSLVAQIVHGAPYDILLSADTDYPRALIASGNADPGSLTVIARGRLVLWTMKSGVELEPISAAMRNPAIRKIAVANLDSAPYGRAAAAALRQLGVWTVARPRLVVGENITQTAQFVETGNADVGFVALSLVRSPRLRGRGHWVFVPAELHPPLEQGAVLTRRGAGNAAAREYLSYLQSPAARAILEQFGYTAP